MSNIRLCLKIIFFVLMSVSSYSLNQFKYTGIAFDGSGNIMASATVSVKVELINSSGPQYSEDHTSVTTDQFGAYTVEVGTGINQTGNLGGINATKDLRIKTSASNGGAAGVWVVSTILKPTVAITSLQGTDNWETVGKTGTVAGTNFAGTGDNTEFELRVKDNAGTYFNSLFIGLNNEIWLNSSGSTVAGNSRGAYAVDLQNHRSDMNRVASGDYSVLGGGNQNRSPGDYATVSGGRNIRRASDYAAIGGGRGNRAVRNYSVISGGYQVSANHNRIKSYAGGHFNNTGDAQTSIFVVRNETSNSTPTALYIDGSSLRMNLDDGDAWTFKALIVGKSDDISNYAAYIVTGMIFRESTTTTINGVTTTLIAESAASYDATATTAANNLVIQVTGDGTNTMHWVARVELTDVHY